jgi:hypothetical protein
MRWLSTDPLIRQVLTVVGPWGRVVSKLEISTTPGVLSEINAEPHIAGARHPAKLTRCLRHKSARCPICKPSHVSVHFALDQVSGVNPSNHAARGVRRDRVMLCCPCKLYPALSSM